MTIQECYQKMGGDYEEVLGRMMNPGFVRKFIARFPGDDSYQKLCEEIKAGNREGAFRAAHTLKGVCKNLGFGTLADSADKMTELLRPKADTIPEGAEEILVQVTKDYEITLEALQEYLAAE